MSVQTTTFGSVRLSGEEAKKFKNQVAYGRPKKAAKITFASGERLAKQFNKAGSVTLRIDR